MIQLLRFSILSAFVIAVALTGGCFRGSSPLNDVKYYVLAAPQEISPSSEAGLATGPRLGVLPVSVPEYLRRTQMVMRGHNSVDVEVDEFSRWGEELELGIMRVVSISVSNRLAAVRGMAVPLRTGVPVDYRLRLEIRKFEGITGSQVALEAVWRIQKDGDPLKEGYFARETAAGSTVSSLVSAQSALLDQLGADIAEGMLTAWRMDKSR